MKKILSFVFVFLLFFKFQIFSMEAPVSADAASGGGMGMEISDDAMPEGEEIVESADAEASADAKAMADKMADMEVEEMEVDEEVVAEGGMGMGEPAPPGGGMGMEVPADEMSEGEEIIESADAEVMADMEVEDDMGGGMDDGGMGMGEPAAPAEGMAAPAPTAVPVAPAAPPQPPVEFEQAKWPQAVELKEEGQALLSEKFKGDISFYIDQANDINDEITEAVKKIQELKKEMWKKFKSLDKKLDLFFQDVGFSTGQKSKERLFFQEKK